MGKHGLLDWSDIEGEWPTLLVGNGASISVWPKFGYGSLYEVAPLSGPDREVFGVLETTNFEAVLGHLRTAHVVCDQLGHSAADVAARYASIRTALIEAVHQRHVAWASVADGDRLLRIRDALLEFESVFSTNYDLLIYWAMMSTGAPPGEGFGDLFWNADHEFDPLDTKPFGNKTLVYWVHGGLHLYRSPTGATRKQTNNGANLLAAFAADEQLPVFVSEGSWQDKRMAIRRSDYLDHAYTTFAETGGRLAVFGQGLSASDSHLIRAIQTDPARDIAFAVFPSSPQDVNVQRAYVEQAFPQANVQFFDSTTHPLGDPALAVG